MKYKIKMPPKIKTKQISLKIDETLLEAAHEMAVRENVTFRLVVESALKLLIKSAQ